MFWWASRMRIKGADLAGKTSSKVCKSVWRHIIWRVVEVDLVKFISFLDTDSGRRVGDI
jgi:hypothetical protein